MSFRWLDASTTINLVTHVASNYLRELLPEMKKVLEVVANDARKEAPVKTGALRKGIVVIAVSQGYSVIGKEYYTIFQEQGTRYFKGKWFMKNAITKNQQNIDRIIIVVLKKLGV